MPKLLEFQAHIDHRGGLFVLDQDLPFDVKRIFLIKDVPASETRGHHRHKKTRQILFCSSGSCVVDTHDGKEQASYELNGPSQALLVEPEDWHIMHSFGEGCVLMVLASEAYDPEDYITTAYS